MEQHQEDTGNGGEKGRRPDACVMVIFGASGDLTGRKLIPALRNLAHDELLPDEFAVVGVARREMSHDQFRKHIRAALDELPGDGVDTSFHEWISSRLSYLSADLKESDSFERLRNMLEEIDEKHRTGGNYLFYLAVAPDFFSQTVRSLGSAGLVQESENTWRRVVIEKPFGRDQESARRLNREIGEVLDECQTYRIDHYLGKETVQNILVFRFANGIFEPVWNRRYIDHVQITVSERLGVEKRGGYYDDAGALRDMVPNHIFQLITLITMEPPVSFDADAVRDEQAKILRALQPFPSEEVLKRAVRGQYGEGTMEGKDVPAYRSEPGVSSDSVTETYVALKLNIDNWRWADVPLYVRTGKRLPCRATEIVIRFKRAPFMLFRETPIERLAANVLVLRIQPDEGISLSFSAKKPGPLVRLGNVDMDFAYRDHFGSTPSTGYERLLYDCMLGDATLFQRADMVEAGWGVVEPILDVWKALPPRDFPNYASGSWGPEAAEKLMVNDGRRWRECTP